MELKLGETTYFDFPTHNSTGEIIDASVIGCEVFEDANDTPILSPTPVKRTGKTGNYRVQIDCTTGNGFEANKTYNLMASATTDKAGKGCIGTFKVRANHVGELAKEETLINEAANLFHLVESQRGSHTGRGKMIHWMPIGGSDGNTGLTRAQSLLTWAAVEALITSYNHDIVFCHPVGGGQPTVVDATFATSKAFILLRGPGRDLKFKPTTSANDTITVAAPGCEISGFIFETHTSGNRDAIKVLADFAKFKSVWVDYSRGHGMAIENSSHIDVDGLIVQDAAASGAGHAVSIKSTSGNAKRNFFRNVALLHNAGNGFQFDGVNTQDNFIFSGERGSSIDLNTGYGVTEINGASHNHVIASGMTIHANTPGNINLTGANSVALNIEQWAKETTNQAEHDATQAAIEEKVSGKVNVLSGAAVSGNTYLRKGGTWTCKRGDFGFNIPFDLGMDITGYTLKWGMKKSVEENVYIVNPTTIAAAQISDWLLGLGTIPITSASQTEQTPNTYYIEIEITKGTTATLSPWDGKLKIEYDIIRPTA